MNDIANSRRAICEFLFDKPSAVTVRSARTGAPALPSSASSLRAVATLGALGLERLWSRHPLKRSVDHALPVAEYAVRRHPWASLGAASAVGALIVLSPWIRKHALRTLQRQVPFAIRQLF